MELSPDQLKEEIYAGMFAICLCAFPVFYIYYKKGCNKLLFVCSNIGAVFILQTIFTVSILPIVIYNIFILPSQFPEGAPNYLHPILALTDWMANNWFMLLIIISFILYIVLPVFIYKRYNVFGKNV